VSRAFHWPLRINAFGVLFLLVGLVELRARTAFLRREAELEPPPSRATAAVGAAS
jgi:hypothetical protein